MVIYDADGTNPVRIKIGDGITVVNNLPFCGSNVQMITWEDND